MESLHLESMTKDGRAIDVPLQCTRGGDWTSYCPMYTELECNVLLTSVHVLK